MCQQCGSSPSPNLLPASLSLQPSHMHLTPLPGILFLSRPWGKLMPAEKLNKQMDSDQILCKNGTLTYNLQQLIQETSPINLQ